MADNGLQNPVTQPTNLSKPGFPVAAIVCLAIGGYVVVIVIIFLIRGCLTKRGVCREQCCGKEGELQCCECCVSCAEGTNCCKTPNIEACLDSICPARKQLDCIDIIMCECCANQDGSCCGSQEPLCDGCNECCKAQCADECNSINCCCFEISLAGGNQPGHLAPSGGYPGYPPYAGYPPYPGAYPSPNGNHQNMPPPTEGYAMATFPGALPLGQDPFLAENAGQRHLLPGGAQPVVTPPYNSESSRMFMAQGAPLVPHPQGHAQSSAAPF